MLIISLICLRCMRLSSKGCGTASPAPQRCSNRPRVTGARLRGCSACFRRSCEVISRALSAPAVSFSGSRDLLRAFSPFIDLSRIKDQRQWPLWHHPCHRQWCVSTAHVQGLRRGCYLIAFVPKEMRVLARFLR